jgi:hypothetical protein
MGLGMGFYTTPREGCNVLFGFELAQLIGLYLPLSVAALAQIVFLFLPIDLRNWDDDSLNVATYVVLQMFVAGLLFVVMPRLSDLFFLDARMAFYVLATVGFLGLVKALRQIPLEKTAPVLKQVQGLPYVNFAEFYDKDRLLQLALLSEADVDDVKRIRNIKERLRKRGRDSARGNALAPKLGPS